MAFGQSCLIQPETKFFNAIALQETVCLTLLKSDFEYIYHSKERKNNNDKIAFIKQIPQFKSLALTRSKQMMLCESLQQVRIIKNTVLFQQNELISHIYFVKQGELQLSQICKTEQETQIPPKQFIEDARSFKPKVQNKTYTIGVVTSGCVLGLDDTYY